MKIQAALVTHVKQPIQIETLELAGPREGEVLVRVAACGVCHSDYHLISGATQHPLPVVPGHEGAGVVEAVGCRRRLYQARRSCGAELGAQLRPLFLLPARQAEFV